MSVLAGAAGSSAIVRGVRRLAAGLRKTRERIAVGLGDGWSEVKEAEEAERVRRLLSTSRIAAVLSSLITVPVTASSQARLKHWLQPLFSLDLPSRIRTGGLAIIVAVVCHTVLLAVIGVPVYALGWTTRAMLVAAGAIALRWPEPFAAAWKDKQSGMP